MGSEIVMTTEKPAKKEIDKKTETLTWPRPCELPWGLDEGSGRSQEETRKRKEGGRKTSPDLLNSTIPHRTAGLS